MNISSHYRNDSLTQCDISEILMGSKKIFCLCDDAKGNVRQSADNTKWHIKLNYGFITLEVIPITVHYINYFVAKSDAYKLICVF